VETKTGNLTKLNREIDNKTKLKFKTIITLRCDP